MDRDTLIDYPSHDRGQRVASGPVAGHVLVVDDEESLVRAYTRILTRAGFSVTAAYDGHMAAEKFRNARFDAVIADLRMPGMSGVNLLRVVRERDLDTPVILASATTSFDIAVEAIELGAFRYLLKPVDPKLLVQTVAQAVRLYRIAEMKREALSLLGTVGHGVGDRAGLEGALERALDTLWVAYQPIVSWSQRKVFGYEALVRTREPLLPTPGDLFDCAERLDRVHEIGRAVRDRVAANIADAPPGARIFVNLHPQDLADDMLLNRTAPLSRHAHRVVLEITERATLDKVTDVRGRVAELRKMGYRIAIDDLGAGYAGLTSFAQLEPEVVKLDMSLVRGIDGDATRRKLVRSMTALCRELHMEVISEGIETAAERDTIAEVGCDLMQGYLFARPGEGFPIPSWE